MSYVLMVLGFFVLTSSGFPGLQSFNPEERKRAKVVTVIGAALLGCGILLLFLGI